MQTSCISFSIGSSDYSKSIGVIVRLNNQVLFEQQHLTELVNFSHNISDEPGEHELEIQLINKKLEHTKIDQQGNLTEDVVLEITNLAFDGLYLTNILSKVAEYHHSYNGNSKEFVDKFFGVMGCNGTVKIKFTTPIYIWLLENL